MRGGAHDRRIMRPSEGAGPPPPGLSLGMLRTGTQLQTGGTTRSRQASLREGAKLVVLRRDRKAATFRDNVPCLTEIFVEIYRPPMTASAVQHE